MARPWKNLDTRQIETLARIGCPDVEIAEVLGCHVSHLTKRYSEFLAKGRSNLHKRLRKKQIELALRGNCTMLIWLGKQYLGQKDRADVTSNDEAAQFGRISLDNNQADHEPAGSNGNGRIKH